LNLQSGQGSQEHKDLIIVGAGLAAAMLVLRLSHGPNKPSVLILERSAEPFGNKTWSMQATDINTNDRAWLEKAIFAEWPRQCVKFQSLERVLETGYVSINSASLRATVTELPNVEVRPNHDVLEISDEHVRLSDGTSITAPCVLDARGHVPHEAMELAYQKFVGWTVETTEPHGVAEPVIMDGSVEQIDGFRFVYLLPFSENRILIEDTRYSDDVLLNEAEIEETIRLYAEKRGWTISKLVHREAGVLPITLAFDRQNFHANRGGCPSMGMRAGLFHATTGYSLPDAVRVANIIADADSLRSDEIANALMTYGRKRARVQAFYRFLNRMLFKAAEPDRRHLVMQKFYRLPRQTIERFYAGRTTIRDITRILSGEPPVPIARALPCILEPRVKMASK